MVHGLPALVIIGMLAGSSIWQSGVTLRGRRPWAALPMLTGIGLVIGVALYEIAFVLLFGNGGKPRLLEGELGIVGGALWLVSWLAIGERRLAVREILRLDDLKADKATINDNPNWVREQLLAQPTPPDWKGLLPLVEAGWNGGFAWLTPELVREQIGKQPILHHGPADPLL
ncbi:MAG: hypothetical protein ABIZ70_05870 [Gemmatimonadales bacterium]